MREPTGRGGDALRDVTARKKSEATFRSLLEAAPEAMVIVDRDGRVVLINSQAERLFGYSREELLGRPVEDLVPSRFRQGHPAHRTRYSLNPRPRLMGGGLALAGRRKDGSEFPVEISLSAVETEEGMLVTAAVRDVTEQKRLEEQVRQREEQYRLLFESNPHPMWVYDPETLAFLAVNDAAVRQYGWSREEFLGMTTKEIRPAEEVPAFLQALKDTASQGAGPTAEKHRTKNGAVREVEVASDPILFHGRPARLALANDVTDKQRLEAQLAQAQKIDAIGRLAGGVAHDFNNLLGVIMGFSELLLKDIGEQHRGRKRVEQIRKAADRAAGLTRQLLAFSRKQMLQPKVLALNEVVTEIEKMLRRLIGEDIRLVTSLGALPGHVKADPGQIEQVIVNLAVNSRDAMPKGGRLIIETANAVLDEAYVRSHPYVRPGPYVMLAVSDTGQGMDAQTLSHIFEPFFTTKEPGKGTGLGLATVFGIVKQSGGHINVYSEPGKGTTFKVYLPRVDAKGDARVQAVAEPTPAGHETVLLVEDEQAIRLLIREVLETAGYTVLDAARPEDAASIVGSHAGAIQLLLTDVILPGMSGADLAARVKEIRPDTKILFMSGYTDEAIGHHGVLEPGTHFLQKPFAAEALLRKVRKVLDAPARPESQPRSPS